MTIEYVRYRIPADKHSAFVKDYREAAKQITASEHCLAYDLSQCEEEADRFVLRIQWTSTKAHLEGFRQSEEFQKFLPLVRPYIEFLEEMQHYAPIPLDR